MKKLILSLLFAFLMFPNIAKATTWYACTSGGNWNGANVWTSIQADQGTCVSALGNPVAGDTAIMNSSSGNITITAAAAAASVTMTGYTGTFAIGAQTLTVNGGTVLLATGNTITASSGGMTITGTETLTSGGQTWPGTLNFNVAGTVTLANSGATWTNTGLVTFSANTNVNLTSPGDTLTANGGLTMTVSSGTTPTATIILGGGTWSGAGSPYNNLTLAGNITISNSSGVDYRNGTLTYSSGTITTTGSTLSLKGTCTLNTSGMNWNNVSVAAAGGFVVTLTSNLNITGTFSDINQGNLTLAGAFNISTGTLTISSVGVGEQISLVAGQTLTVSSALNLVGNSSFGVTIKSGTSSSSTALNYTGTQANDNVYDTVFTDINAAGSSGTIYNYNGGTLTRVTNIANITAANVGGIFIQ